MLTYAEMETDLMGGKERQFKLTLLFCFSFYFFNRQRQKTILSPVRKSSVQPISSLLVPQVFEEEMLTDLQRCRCNCRKKRIYETLILLLDFIWWRDCDISAPNLKGNYFHPNTLRVKSVVLALTTIPWTSVVEIVMMQKRPWNHRQTFSLH